MSDGHIIIMFRVVKCRETFWRKPIAMIRYGFLRVDDSIVHFTAPVLILKENILWHARSTLP